MAVKLLKETWNLPDLARDQACIKELTAQIVNSLSEHLEHQEETTDLTVTHAINEVIPKCEPQLEDLAKLPSAAVMFSSMEAYTRKDLWQKDTEGTAYLRHKAKTNLRPVSFWEWVLAHPEIPLVVTEGAKKVGAILTAGYVAIALPGIFNGYRQPKDEWGRSSALPSLIPQLEVLAEGGRDIYFAFDQDTKPKTIANVNTAITKTGKLLAKKGCKVKVITWSQPEKGVDDLIATHGEDAFHTAYNTAEDLETWLTRQSLSN
ncbi:MAG: DUF3854 domain-containing protein [Hydrococcus sp. SU_1_0]|nr:DUF3854 domain-containing protein [Hydrococcus sp. SU_1_0]NJO98400.1 DUF3854 domain-containing protein [Pleurocapsa sp. CRU_1_2]